MFRNSILIVLLCVLQRTFCLRNSTNEGCDWQPDCLKCGPRGCIKCQSRILYPSRKCVDVCPGRHVEKWSTLVDYMGRICKPSLHFAPNETASIFAGVAAGVVLCAVVIVSALVYLRYKQRASRNAVETHSDADDSQERRDFLKQVENLQPHADCFLEMLNDARRHVREAHLLEKTADTSAHKQIIHKLARLLVILNKPSERVAIPDDWERLYTWGRRVVEKFKRMSDDSQPQVMQLVTFLQSSGAVDEGDPNLSRGTTMSTFKPEQISGSSLSLQDVAIRNFNSNYNNSTFHTPLNPQWMFDYALLSPNTVASSQFDPTAWENNKECLKSSYFLDDDFCQLGFRPQDEITTEL